MTDTLHSPDHPPLDRWSDAVNRPSTLVTTGVVLGVLMALVWLGLAIWPSQARSVDEDRIRLARISEQVWEFRAAQSPVALPDSLDALVTPPAGEWGYIRAADVRDHKGRPILYTVQGDARFVLLAVGEDGQAGTADDLRVEEAW